MIVVIATTSINILQSGMSRLAREPRQRETGEGMRQIDAVPLGTALEVDTAPTLSVMPRTVRERTKTYVACVSRKVARVWVCMCLSACAWVYAPCVKVWVRG
eukprot:GHVU01093943.1.p2 GENE.GHVU01093943.1~~GHVU01093943.1.p2  ORF type:complete len:102 (-),score=0.44 GHVU01093943.1:522-827(-)